MGVIMTKLQSNQTLSWEAYKYLSRTELDDCTQDIYYYLTYQFLEQETEKTFSAKLDNLLYRAINETITSSESDIKDYIKNFKLERA